MRSRRLLPTQFLVDDLSHAAVAPLGDGYDVQIVEAGQPLTFSPPTLQVGLVTGASVPFTPGPDGRRYTVGVRARVGESASRSATLQLNLVSVGGRLAGVPNPVSRLTVMALGGGWLDLRWAHSDAAGTVPAAGFRVYVDGVWSAEADALARRLTVAVSPGARYMVSVRAVSIDGVEDGGGVAVWAVSHSQSPPPGPSVLLVQTPFDGG